MVPPKAWKTSSDSQTSITHHPLSVGPATWDRMPSTGQASGELSVPPPVSLRATSSYCSRVPPVLSWIIRIGNYLLGALSIPGRRLYASLAADVTERPRELRERPSRPQQAAA